MYHTIRAFVKICTYARMSRTIKASNSSAYTFHGLLTNDPVSKNYSIISWSIRSFIFFYFRYSRISTTHHYRQWINFKFKQWSQCAHDPNRNNNKKKHEPFIDWLCDYNIIMNWTLSNLPARNIVFHHSVRVTVHLFIRIWLVLPQIGKAEKKIRLSYTII